MSNKRVLNFNAGPSALPLKVLEEIQASFLNFNYSGMSITEISHRSSDFDAVINDTVKRIKNLFGLDERFHVLFIQGGASMQFAMIPMNFLTSKSSADYINTGIWATKAIHEAKIQGKNIRVAASSEDKNFSYIPKNINIAPNAHFIHITSNNTVKGTQFLKFPETGNVPIICDMSSDIFSRPLPINKFGMIYAGAQKNLGIPGTCMVIIQDQFLKTANKDLPTMLSYQTYANTNSMYNTPPCFGIYTIGLMLKWLEEEFGNLELVHAYNKKKASLLYDFMDSGDFYKPTANKADRSLMNITFNLPNITLEERFVKEAASNGLVGLKGHRSVGGCRASIYNAATIESIEALVEFMDLFQKEAVC